MSSLREYLTANLLDGEEAGSITIRASDLLDAITENVMHYLIGDDDQLPELLLEYFGAVRTPETPEYRVTIETDSQGTILRRMWDEVKNFNCDCHEEETSA